MALADLKKNSTQSKSAHQQIQTSQLALDDLIDDFINDASRYAVGEAQLAPNIGKVIALNISHDESDKNTKVVTKGNVPFRKATFTLSETAITRLAALADNCDMAKSKLIRFLIEHHFDMTPQQRRVIEQSIIVE